MSDADQGGGLDGLIQRIDERLAALGLNDSAASTAAFGHHKGIAHLRKGGTKSPGLGTIKRLATVLDVSPAWLAWGAGESAPRRTEERAAPAAGLRFLGKVAAGLWLDEDIHIDAAPLTGAPVAPNPRWPAKAQFVVQIEGTSVNKVAPSGALLVCVNPKEIDYKPQNGDLVIVERRREDRAQTERTAKRYHARGSSIELWPQSTDPAHKPIIFDPKQPSEGMEVRIIGLVDRAVYRVEPFCPWEAE